LMAGLVPKGWRQRPQPQLDGSEAARKTKADASFRYAGSWRSRCRWLGPEGGTDDEPIQAASKKILSRCERADKTAMGRILDELCATPVRSQIRPASARGSSER